jgi:hypothetical protein
VTRPRDVMSGADVREPTLEELRAFLIAALNGYAVSADVAAAILREWDRVAGCIPDG